MAATTSSILHISTFDQGGAANACIRLHLGLRAQHHASKLLVLKSTRKIPESYAYPTEGGLTSWASKKWRKYLSRAGVAKDPFTNEWARLAFQKKLPPAAEYFSFPVTKYDITRTRWYAEADIIHLHWVADFLDYPSFFASNKKPVVWTLHDMGPFLGGNHYETGFTAPFPDGTMPALHEEVKKVMKKSKAIKHAALASVKNLTVVAPSQWLTNKSAADEDFGRFPQYTIPYGLNEQIFQPRPQGYSRELLGLDPHKKCFVFVADHVENKRKGFAYLQRALELLGNKDITLCAVGQYTGQVNERIHFLGSIGDERLMSAVYSAADAFIIPSLEDNLPNTVVESLCCGTPVVGFPAGGIPEMIREGVNGLICSAISAEALAEAVKQFLQRAETFNRVAIAQEARAKYALAQQAQAYQKLYQDILQQNRQV